MGKRLHAEFFLEELDAGHEVEGCNYLLALEMEMDPVPGYALASWETRIRRLRAPARSRDVAAGAVARGDRARALRRRLARRLAGRPFAAAGAEGAGREGARARLRRDVRLGARVLPLARELRRGAREALPRPDAVGAVHPRLPHPRLGLRRAASCARCGNAMAAAGMRVESLEGRGVAGPARDQLPLRGRGEDRGRPRRLQDTGSRRSRYQHGMLGHVHGEAGPHLGRLVVPHPLVAVAGRQGGVRGRVGRVQALPRRPDRVRARSSRSSSRRRSTRTSASPPAAGRRRRSPGGTTTARAASASSATARRCGRDAHPGRRREPVSRLRGADRGAGLYGIEQSSSSGRPFEGNAYESDVRAVPARRCARRSPRSRTGRRAAAFGDEVIDHYLNYARTEQRLFDQVVTCYERERMFERG